MATDKQVTDVLVALYTHVHGMTQERARARAADQLDAAKARVAPLVKNPQDIPGWRAACVDLKGWVEANP